MKHVGAGAVAAGGVAAAYYLYGTGLRRKTEITIPTSAQTETARSTTRLKEGYPLLGIYDHWNLEIQPREAQQYARWNMLALNYENAHYSTGPLKEIKNLNPNTRILAWISLGFYWISTPRLGGYLEAKLLADSSEDWWIHKRGTGAPSSRRLQMVPWYPGFVTPNPKSGFSERVVKFLQEEVMSTDLYDGVFFDCVWDDGWISQQLEDTEVSASECREGITNILRETREKLGPDIVIMGNPGVEWSDTCSYWEYASGHYQENALGDVFGSDWNRMWEICQRNMRKESPPRRVHWIGVDTQYKRDRKSFELVTRKDLTDEDLRRMRLGLGTALLLDDCYFGFDLGDGWHGHGEQWWFPEYNANLGFPRRDHERASDGTYRRRYDHGLVIVNPESNRTVDLDASYRDVTTNEIVNQITVFREDARILVEP